MKVLIKLLKSHLTGKKLIILFILTNLIYGLMLLVTIPQTMFFAGEMKLLDMMPLGYNSEYILKLMETLGEQGREVYLYRQIPVDMVYPFLFAACYSLLMAYILVKLNKFKSPLIYLSFLPIIAGAADYLENISIISMLMNFPNLSSLQMTASNSFTLVKSLTTTLYFVALIAILISYIIKIIFVRK